jgi:hypothetical protein
VIGHVLQVYFFCVLTKKKLLKIIIFFVEDLFDVISCYFPITFRHQPTDPAAITQVILFAIRC